MKGACAAFVVFIFVPEIITVQKGLLGEGGLVGYFCFGFLFVSFFVLGVWGEGGCVSFLPSLRI